MFSVFFLVMIKVRSDRRLWKTSSSVCRLSRFPLCPEARRSIWATHARRYLPSCWNGYDVIGRFPRLVAVSPRQARAVKWLLASWMLEEEFVTSPLSDRPALSTLRTIYNEQFVNAGTSQWKYESREAVSHVRTRDVSTETRHISVT